MSQHLLFRIILQVIAILVLGYCYFFLEWDSYKQGIWNKKEMTFITIWFGGGFVAVTLFNWCVKFTINGVIG